MPSPGGKVAEHSEAIWIAMLASGKHTIKIGEVGRGTAISEVQEEACYKDISPGFLPAFLFSQPLRADSFPPGEAIAASPLIS